VKRRQIHRLRRGAIAEHVGSTVQQLPLPIVDLCGVQLKLLAKLGHGFILAQRCQCHLGLERRVV
jgi:hypothetical protein